jgi:L-2-hydroxyglutarate oxidase LhgO
MISHRSKLVKSNNSFNADFLVIGAGVVGLSLGLELLKEHPKSRVIVADKEREIGKHASGRNSGVLHAGFYYSPDSLKAKFCRDGNEALKRVIRDNQIPIREIGKVVVATDQAESLRLAALYERGVRNGVVLEHLPEAELSRFEPLAATCESFLWSPTTAVSDPIKVLSSLAVKFVKEGGKLLLGQEVIVKDDSTTWIGDKQAITRHVFNCAGVNAVHIAKVLGQGTDYALLPVLGLYKTNSIKQLPLRTLVYPVPSPSNPFLGVHFTLTVDGHIKIGPTAIPVVGREQYNLKSIPDLQDFVSTTTAIRALVTHSFQETLKLSVSEFSKVNLKYLLRESSNLVPAVKNTTGWKSKSPGLRAQLINLSTGQFEQDFVVRTHENFTHVLNAVSPGWTASIPFSKWIVAQFASEPVQKKKD